MRSGAIVGQTTVHQKELVIVTDSDLVLNDLNDDSTF